MKQECAFMKRLGQGGHGMHIQVLFLLTQSFYSSTGAGAGFACCLVNVPSELVKIRMQVCKT